MPLLLLWLARMAGLAGVLLCLIAVFARLAGHHWMVGFETLTLLQGGMAAMLFACLTYLVRLAEFRQDAS